jgi:hypothetical protein
MGIVASYKNVREVKDTDLRKLGERNGGWDGVNDERKTVRSSAESRRLSASEEAGEEQAARGVSRVDALAKYATLNPAALKRKLDRLQQRLQQNASSIEKLPQRQSKKFWSETSSSAEQR